MIRIFPDFSVQVTASAAGGAVGGGGGGGGGGGMVTGPPVGRVPVPVPGATNGTPQSVQGITAYQQRKGASGYFYATQEDKIQYPHFGFGIIKRVVRTSVCEKRQRSGVFSKDGKDEAAEEEWQNQIEE
eukprot:superscaffoldBa00008240_g23183